MTEISYRFRLRSGTAALGASANEILLANEIGYETDTGKFKVGDGATPWLSLPYFTVLDTVLRCDLVAVTALPSNAYANGSGGVGATLTMAATGTLSVDGRIVALGDRILVTGEAAAANNGVYAVTTAGAVGVAAVLTRVPDFNRSEQIPGRLVTLGPRGASSPSTLWLCTAVALPTIGTTAITFATAGGGGGSAGRSTVSVNSPAGAAQNGTLIMGKQVTLLNLSSNSPLRIRLYTTVAHQTADQSRPASQYPAAGSGLLFEGVTTSGLLSFDITSCAAFNNESTVVNSIAYRIEPAVSVSTTATFTFTVTQS